MAKSQRTALHPLLLMQLPQMARHIDIVRDNGQKYIDSKTIAPMSEILVTIALSTLAADKPSLYDA